MIDTNFYLFITNIAVAVLCGALMSVMPLLTRKSFLFGVKIPIEKHGTPEAGELKKRYITFCITGASFILALIILQYWAFPSASLVSVLYFPLLFIAVQMAAFIPCWKKAGQLKLEKGWAVTDIAFAETKSSHSRGNLSQVPLIWYILSLALIIISVVVTIIKYPGLPDKIPTHFDVYMQPDAWSDKSLSAVMALPIINLVTLITMWLTGIILVRTKLQIDQQNAALSFSQHCIYRRRMGFGLGITAFCIALMMTIISFKTIYPDFSVSFWLMLGLPLLPTALLIGITVSSGQGGCRIKPKAVPKEFSLDIHNESGASIADIRGDDKYWALGMFYHNPDDPSCFVEDRFGMNMGFNYSRLPVKIGLIVMLLGLIILYGWMTVLLCSI